MNLNGRLSYEGNVSGSLGADLVADVEANPSGPATQTLVKIRVGDIIYSIPTGGGGGGVTSYSLLTDKPKINNHTIDGEMTAADLDLQDKIDFPEDGSKYLDGNGSFSTPALCENYSTNEQVIGSWINNEPLYQKTVKFGTLPNNSSKSIAHNISNLDFIVSAEMTAKSSTGYIPIPFVHRSSIGNQIQLGIDSVNINVFTATNQTNYIDSYITIRYTKTTD